MGSLPHSASASEQGSAVGATTRRWSVGRQNAELQEEIRALRVQTEARPVNNPPNQNMGRSGSQLYPRRKYYDPQPWKEPHCV